MEKCPCGSRKSYAECCEPYITGKTQAPTAEALMRARYTAYTKCAVEYIEATHSLEQRDHLDVEETRKWATESEWLGLEIIGTQKGGPGDSEGVVEFVAKYRQNGMENSHHEISEFQKIDDKWFFKEGRVAPTTVTRSQPKVGRNDPCPCGSGKKAKKCCYK